MKNLQENVKLGARLRDLRNARGWSQLAVGAKLDLSDSAYGKIERGDTTLNLTQLTTLAKEFEMSVGELLGEEKNHYAVANNTNSNCANVNLGVGITNTHNNINQIDEVLALMREFVGIMKEIATHISQKQRITQCPQKILFMKS